MAGTNNFLANTLGSQLYDDLCEMYAELATTGTSGHYPSAINAWNSQQKSAIPGSSLAGIKPGDVVYFSANAGNNYFGHAGIYMGNGQFESATDNGVGVKNINDWSNATGQSVLGYVPQGNFGSSPSIATVDQPVSTVTQPKSNNSILAALNLHGSYDPTTLTQDQRQSLWSTAGHTGTAPVGYGGEAQPSSNNNAVAQLSAKAAKMQQIWQQFRHLCNGLIKRIQLRKLSVLNQAPFQDQTIFLTIRRW